MSAEYVNDIPYVRHLIADLSPARLRMAAAVSGLPAPPNDDFDYCELGCAHGDTLAANAAAYPNARFIGVDISAAHVSSAKKLARDGGLENVFLLERDFADLITGDQIADDQLDYVVAHGVLSWVSPQKRAAMIDFAKKKLKPGGILYVSYNAMPGWGAIEPLRQLLLTPVDSGNDGSGGGGGNSLERAKRGLELAHAMDQSGAEYFKRNPVASEMLAMMTKAGLPYIVHEYLHEHWVPMYFARVAWEMTSSDLHFVGVLPLHLNFRDTALPPQTPGLEKVFESLTDRMMFESLKDFARNEFFRCDLYVKGKVARSSDETDTYLDTTAWGTAGGTNAMTTLEGPVFAAILAVLAKGAKTPLMILASDPELAALGIGKVRAAILRLLIAGNIIPMQSPTTVPSPSEVEGSTPKFTVPSPYNQMMLKRISSDKPTIITSVIGGTAVVISALDGIALRVLGEAASSSPADCEVWIADYVGRHVLRLVVGDRTIEDRDEQRRAITEALDRLRTRDLSKLLELGILAPASPPP